MQAYGYNYLPLLLTLASPPLSALLPNPLPSTTPAAVTAAAKFPYTSLRKSLRLLIEDPDPLEELENDISYVYSGYAPLSVRLVQCIAQKGGVLSNPAGEKDKKVAASDQSPAKAKGAAAPKVQAHPIVGWKGFEDVVGSIPGQTFDIVQKLPGKADAAAHSLSTLSESFLVLAPRGSSSGLPRKRHAYLTFRAGGNCQFDDSASQGTADDDGRILPGRMYIYGDRRSALGWEAEHRCVCCHEG